MRETVAAPMGTPYHRLARTEQHRWWRPLIGTLLVLVLVGWGIFFFAVPLVYSFSIAPIWAEAGTNLLIAMAIPVIFCIAWLVQRRPAGSVSSVRGRLRWQWQVTCVGAAGIAIPISYLVIVFLALVFPVTGEAQQQAGESAHWVGWLPFLGAAVVLLLTVPLQAAGEEYVFRAWIVQFFGCYLRNPWVGITISGLLFALVHTPSTPWGFADLMLFSLVTGWLVIRTGGLEAAIAFHVVGNLFVFIGSAAFGGLGEGGNAGDAPWLVPVANAIVLPLYAWLVLLLARQTPLQALPTEHCPA